MACHLHQQTQPLGQMTSHLMEVEKTWIALQVTDQLDHHNKRQTHEPTLILMIKLHPPGMVLSAAENLPSQKKT